MLGVLELVISSIFTILVSLVKLELISSSIHVAEVLWKPVGGDADDRDSRFPDPTNKKNRPSATAVNAWLRRFLTTLRLLDRRSLTTSASCPAGGFFTA
ncbi:MAG: hypothetical protein ACQEXQ_27305 [Bacillota bacterium]